jgi:formate hydrogenlyase subunit 3/multisubunit Na+/H+ antiporter MnhD subunit
VTGQGLLLLVVALPLSAAVASLVLVHRRPELALRVSLAAALMMALAATFAVVDVRLQLVAGRALVLTAPAQLGVQLVALMVLGLVLSLRSEPADVVGDWLPVLWFSAFGLALALLLSELALALLVLLSAALLLALGLSSRERTVSREAVMRYAALLVLAMPLLMLSIHAASQRTSATPELERLVLAFAVPGFGLLLGVIPLHAWALTLASGTPRIMLFAAVGLVQTAGFTLLLRTVAKSPWMLEGAQVPLLIGGAVSALVGGWLALSARIDDPDDFLVYALVANAGFLLAGLGSHSKAAAAGVTLLLLSRVLALVVLTLAPQVSRGLGRLAYAVGLLTLAATPGLAGFPGLWLILRRLLETTTIVVPLALLLGCLMLFGAAVRRWPVVERAEPTVEVPGSRRAVSMLIVLLVLLGVFPYLVAPAFTGAVDGVFFPLP